MDTLIGPLLAGAFSGAAVSALITAVAASLAVRRSTREKARQALWAYQRAMAGYGSKAMNRAGFGEDQLQLIEANLDDVQTTLTEAYRWAGYLSVDSRSRLIRQASIAIGEPPWVGPYADENVGISALNMAEALEDELDRVFPLTVTNWAHSRLNAVTQVWKSAAEQPRARAWLKEQGAEVPEKGPIPEKLLAQYRAR